MQDSFHHEARTLTPEEIEILVKDKTLVTNFKQEKLEKEAKKNWDLFYKRNETRFFKDRHWTKREFEELDLIIYPEKNNEDNHPRLLEIGCGVGNLIFPLISEGSSYFIYACDFSPRAIELLKANPLYNPSSCHAFVCDITSENDLLTHLSPGSIHVSTLIFVLSAIHPDKMITALQAIYKVLAPGGLVLFRDYGLFDQAMLRFKPGHKLGENLYVRQDGTRAFYFPKEHVKKIFGQAGFSTLNCEYICRKTVNKKEGIEAPRVFVQGKFQKPH